MKTILEQNSEVVRQAGKDLVKIGADLAAGHIDRALDTLETAKQEYREWVELDKAIADIEQVERDQRNKQAVQLVLVKLVGTILATSMRGQSS